MRANAGANFSVAPRDSAGSRGGRSRRPPPDDGDLRGRLADALKTIGRETLRMVQDERERPAGTSVAPSPGRSPAKPLAKPGGQS